MSVTWSDKTREGFTYCVECGKRGNDCPGWKKPTGGCGSGAKMKESASAESRN